MLLEIGERVYEVESQEREIIVSKHTGKELEKLNLRINFRGNVSEFEEALNDEVQRVDDQNNVINTYQVNNRSYSYTGSESPNTVYKFNLELIEVEELNIEKLMIENIELQVYEYSEEYREDGLRIDTKAKIPYEKLDEIRRIRESKEYFEVVRKGISEEKKQMRFGKVIWSKHDNFTKHDMVLVEKSYDEGDEHMPMFYPELTNIMEHLSYSSILLEKISDLLISEGLISEDGFKEIEEEAINKISERKREFYLVEDVDREQ